MWFYIALATSLFSAISVILTKKILKGVSPLVLTWCTLLLATPIIAVFAIKEGVPILNSLFFISVLCSVIFYTLSKVLQYRAIKIADLSAIYPLVSFGPIFTLLASTLPPLNEKSGLLSVVGIIITLFGAYILNVGKAKEGLLEPIRLLFRNKASALMILSVFVHSFTIIFDKFAIQNVAPQNTSFVLLVENILVIIILLPILFFRNSNFYKEILLNKKLFIALGILDAISTILAFSAIGQGNVGVLSTIFRVQLLFVLLFSLVFFKDKPRLETIIGSIIMIVGVILIKVGL